MSHLKTLIPLPMFSQFRHHIQLFKYATFLDHPVYKMYFCSYGRLLRASVQRTLKYTSQNRQPPTDAALISSLLRQYLSYHTMRLNKQFLFIGGAQFKPLATSRFSRFQILLCYIPDVPIVYTLRINFTRKTSRF